MDLVAERSYPTPLVNAALLPLLLMSLARQKHSPNTAETVNREYDYVIVGAGSAGSVVASRLSEIPCVSVLLLEAGKSPPLLTEVPAISRSFWFSDIDWQYKTVPQKYTGALLNNRQVIWPGGKALGGSSVLSGMLYDRGNQKNYDQWAAEGAEGWSYEDVLPYFKKLEDNRDAEYVSNGYHGVQGPQTVHRPRYQPEMKDPIFQAATSMGYRVVDPNGPSQTGFYDLQSTMRSGQRCSTAKAYLVPAENRTNLDILPNAFVRKVLIKNRQAVGVQFDFEGKTYEVKARKEVIMSAGTVNTAHLLMLSGIGPRKELERFKIPVIADLPVGKNLQDHAASNLNFELSPTITPYPVKVSSPASIARYIQNRTGPLGSSEFCSAIAFLRNRAILPKQDFPDYAIVWAEASPELGTQIGLTPEAQASIYAPYEMKPFYTCLVHLLHPRSRGTVTLQSANPYDPPLIDPNYFDDPKDMDDLVEGLKVCNRVGNSPEMRNIGSVPLRTLIPGCEQYVADEESYLRCLAKSIVFTVSHQVGTAKMGDPEDPRTVVDPQLRVKSIKGLRVVDASVMPLVPSGNTNIPTIMVAEKASDIIKSAITCHSTDIFHDMAKTEEFAFSGDILPTYSDLRPHDSGKSANGNTFETSQVKEDWRILPTSNDEGNNPSVRKVLPWNMEISNAVPWNTEVIPSLLINQLLSVNGSQLQNNNLFQTNGNIITNAINTNLNDPGSQQQFLNQGAALPTTQSSSQPGIKASVSSQKKQKGSNNLKTFRLEIQKQTPQLPIQGLKNQFLQTAKQILGKPSSDSSKYNNSESGSIISKGRQLKANIANKLLNKAKNVLSPPNSTPKPNNLNSEQGVGPSSTDLNFTSSCDQNFCVSLLNFMQCQESESCGRKVEFAALLFRLLCMT